MPMYIRENLVHIGSVIHYNLPTTKRTFNICNDSRYMCKKISSQNTVHAIGSKIQLKLLSKHFPMHAFARISLQDCASTVSFPHLWFLPDFHQFHPHSIKTVPRSSREQFLYYKLLFLTPPSAFISAAGSSPAPAQQIPQLRRGKWPVMISLLASHVLRGKRKTQLLLNTTVGAFSLFERILSKAAQKPGSFFSFFLLQLVFPKFLFLSSCSCWCLSGDLLLSRTPQKIPWICINCSWSATGKLCSGICQIFSSLTWQGVSLPVRTN